MGIPGFFGKWIRNRYRGAISPIPNNIKTLSIDLNHILHTIFSEVYGTHIKSSDELKYLDSASECVLYGKFFYKLIQKISSMCIDNKVRNTLIIAIDGVAPVAKIQEQRRRRYKSAMIRPSEQIFDSNVITPGTDFMMRLDKDLMHEFNNFNKDRGIFPPRIIYSGHMIPGEAEHKIMRLFRNKTLFNPDEDGYHILHGFDADLIVLSLISPLHEKILILREDIKTTINDMIVTNVIFVDTLYKTIEKEFGEGSITDFFFITLFLGNDFIPRGPFAHKLEDFITEMVDKYKELKSDGFTGFVKIVEGKYYFRLRDITKFVESLLPHEDRMLEILTIAGKENWYTNDRFGVKNTGLETLLLKFVDNDVEELLEPYSEDMILKICKEYYSGMLWTLSYYFEGMSTVSSEWYYPFHYSPLLSDLLIYFQALDNSAKKGDGKYRTPKVRYNKSQINFTVVHQLLSVIPPLSGDILPTQLQGPSRPNSVIADLFPTKIEIDTSGTFGNEFEMKSRGLPLMPPVDIYRINKAVEKMGRVVDFSLWEEKKTMSFKSSEVHIDEYNKKIQILNEFLGNGPIRKVFRKTIDSGKSRTFKASPNSKSEKDEGGSRDKDNKDNKDSDRKSSNRSTSSTSSTSSDRDRNQSRSRGGRGGRGGRGSFGFEKDKSGKIDLNSKYRK